MSTLEVAYLVTGVLGLGLASVAIQNATTFSGWKLLAYLLSLVALGTLGALIAENAGEGYWPVGVAVGMGIVELGPTMATAMRKETRKRIGRVFDKLSPEKEPGYSGDHE